MDKFPETLPWSHINQIDVYTLRESQGLDYAFYQHDLSLGFKHGIEIVVGTKKKRHESKKCLVRVQYLSGNSWGKGTWIIVDLKFFMSVEDAIGHLTGETRIYKPKRKPELIRAMTEKQIKEYWGIKICQE